MIFFYIKDNTDFWEKAQKAVRVFACFRYKKIGAADSDIAADGLINAADGQGRILIGC